MPLRVFVALLRFGFLVYHFYLATHFNYFEVFIKKGYLGVDLFFILSGFILSYVHQKDFLGSYRTTVHFYLLRLARIIPVHYLVLLIYIAYQSIKAFLLHKASYDVEVGTISDILINLLNIQAWGIQNHHSWNAVSWSISAEWFAYLIFPLLSHYIWRLNGLIKNIGVIILCLSSLYLVTCAVGNPEIGWSISLGLLRVLPEFIIGCVLYNIYKETIGNPKARLDLLGLTIIITSLALQLPDIIIVASLPILLMGLALNKGIISNCLSSKPMVYLGEISFSLYMIHYFILQRFGGLEHKFSFTSSSLGAVIALLIYIGICILSSHVLYSYIEVPARNAIRNWLKQGKSNTQSLAIAS